MIYFIEQTVKLPLILKDHDGYVTSLWSNDETSRYHPRRQRPAWNQCRLDIDPIYKSIRSTSNWCQSLCLCYMGCNQCGYINLSYKLYLLLHYTLIHIYTDTAVPLGNMLLRRSCNKLKTAPLQCHHMSIMLSQITRNRAIFSTTYSN